MDGRQFPWKSSPDPLILSPDMASESRPEPGSEDPKREEFLISEVGLNSPLEELRLVFEKRLWTARNLGVEEKARLLETAHELARKRLAIALGEDP